MHRTAVKRALPSSESEGDASRRKKSKRRRATLACEECRQRKRRCDGAAGSCGACMKRRTRCVYASDQQAREWALSTIQTLRNQLDELEYAGRPSAPRSKGHNSAAMVPISTDTFAPASREISTPPSENGILNEVTLEDGLIPLQNTTSTAYLASISRGSKLAPEDNAFAQANLFDGAPELQDVSPVDTDDSCDLERMMKPINQVIARTEYEAGRSTGGREVFTASDHSSNGKLATEVCKCDRLLNSRRQWMLPLRRHADSLVQKYFSRHNISFPILHEPTFRRQYAQIWDSAPDANQTKLATCSGLCKQRSQGQLLLPTIYAVFAIASLFETMQLEQNVMSANSFFRFAQEVDILEILDHEVGMELVQLLLLMGRYLQSTERFAKCKNVSGLAIRTAQNMGLQYSIDEAEKRGLFASPPTQLESEMRARVWYGCVLLERETPMYVSFGRSLNGAVGGTKFKLPEAIDDHRLSDNVGESGVQPTGTASLLEPYIQIIKLHDILAQLLDRDTSTSEMQDTASIMQSALRFDTMIIEWRDALPSYLQYERTEDEGDAAESAPSDVAFAGGPTFSKQTKTIYLRYLNARQLILRPALELFFKKQQSKHVSSAKKKVNNTGLEDLMLGRIAAECVVSALHIVEMLASPKRSHDCMAWWFNIAFLHTCGSTILMGNMCTFTDATFTTESLTAGWSMCLQNLQRYTRLSSIARRSYCILRQSAKRLGLSLQSQVREGPGTEACGTNLKAGMSQQPSADTVYQQRPTEQGIGVLESYTQVDVGLIERPAQLSAAEGIHGPSEFSEGINLGSIPLPDSDLQFGGLELDDNFWLGGSEAFNWSLMPSLPQSRALSPGFIL